MAAAARDRFTENSLLLRPASMRDIVLDHEWSVERKLPAGATQVKRQATRGLSGAGEVAATLRLRGPLPA
jgi:hypothetical protein